MKLKYLGDQPRKIVAGVGHVPPGGEFTPQVSLEASLLAEDDYAEIKPAKKKNKEVKNGA